MTIDEQLLKDIAMLAHTSVPLEDMSMDDLAARLGMTRMTLYRRAGTRQQIMTALKEMGIDTSERPDVYERVVVATATLLRQRPLADITLDLVADEAGCSLPALYARFGGRQGVLRAVIERYSPLLPVREVVTNETDESTQLRHDIRLLYGTVFEKVRSEWPLMRSLLAELMADPDSDVANAIREWYLPQLTNVLVPLFTRHMQQGEMRQLPIPVVAHALIGPLALHVASRSYLIEHLHFDLPDEEATIDLLTDLFCRAVGNGRAD